MESSTNPAVVASVPQTCLAVCAALHDRDGHTVVAHYGSVAGEIAVCLKSVGLADRSDLGVVELRGDRERLDRALIAHFGDPPLAVGSGRRIDGIWYLRLDARRTLLVGPHAALAAAPAIAGGPGPRQPDAPRHRRIAGDRRHRRPARRPAARRRRSARRPADRRDRRRSRRPQHRRDPAREPAALPGARPRRAPPTPLWARLLTAGEPLGAAFVGHDALTLLDASSVAAG